MLFGIQKNNIDFEILDTGNSKTLVFLDSSEYYKEPETPLLEITLPGFTKYFLANINARKINTFNSNTIGMTETFNSHELVDLPDGVWTFVYKICPYDEVFIQKYYLRTVCLDNKISEIFEYIRLSDCDVERDSKLKQDIVDMLLAIESGKANACKDNVKKATELYQIANSIATKLLNKLSESC